MAFTWWNKMAGRANRSAPRPKSRWHRAQLQLEPLEHRNLLATVLVGPAETIKTIQAGINAASPGDTVAIDPGTYVVDSTTPQPAGGTVYGNFVNKPLTITRNGAGTVIVAPPAAATLADTKNDSSFGGTSINGFIVAASNVTIQNITVDGQANGNATSNFRNGIITDFRNSDLGNVPSGNFDGLNVNHTVVQNILRRGIQVSTNGINNTISANTVTNVQGVLTAGSTDTANAIAVFGGDTVVSGNTVTNSRIGIAANATVTDNFPRHPLVTITGNTLTGNVVGMNLAALANGSTIGNTSGGANTVTTSGGPVGPPTGVGIEVTFSGSFGPAATVTIQGNTVNASANDSAIWLFNNITPVQVLDNTLTLTAPGTSVVSGQRTGVYIFDNNTQTSEAAPSNNSANLLRNTVAGFWRGVDIESLAVNQADAVSATIGDATAANANTFSNATASNPTFGIRALLGPNALGSATATIGLNTFSVASPYKTGIRVDNGAVATFNAATTVYGSIIGLDIEGNSTVNVNAPGVTLNSSGGATNGLKLNGSNAMINGGITLRSNNNFEMDAGFVNVPLDGPATGADFFKNTSGTVTLAAGFTDTYQGNTTINGGVLTQNGTFNFSAHTITLAGASVTLNSTTGGGVDNGRNVFVNGGGDIIQGLTFQNYLAGTTAITVQTGASVLLGGTAPNQQLTINGPVGGGSTGVLVQNGATAAIRGGIVKTVIKNNTFGVDVAGGTVFIENTDLSTNNVGSDGLSVAAGLRARAGDPNNGTDARVDAGQVGGGIDFTGLGSGTVNTLNAGSLGGNTFLGYSDYATDPNNPVVPTTTPQAIIDLNNNVPNSNPGPQGIPFDLQAQNDTFGDAGGPINFVNGNPTPYYTTVEMVVYHDHDDAGIGFINFLRPGSANPSVQPGYPRYYAVDPNRNGGAYENEDPTYAQRSNIKYIRLAFDNVVFVKNGNGSGQNGGVQLYKAPRDFDPANTTPGALSVASPTGNNFPSDNSSPQVGIRVFSAEIDPANTGLYFIDLAFVGTPGTGALQSPSGSLVDSIYKLFLDANNITTGNPNAVPVQPGQSINPSAADTRFYFHRLYGDINGDGVVDSSEQNTINSLNHTNFGQAGYKFYLDYKLQNTIDQDSVNQVATRVNKYQASPMKNNPGFNSQPYPTFGP